MRRKEGPTEVVFNIGSQQGVNNNIAGDMRVYDGQHAEITLPLVQLQQELDTLRKGLRMESLPPSSARVIDRSILEVDEELQRPKPDPHKIAAGMERVTRTLKAAGSLAAAGLSVITPLHSIAALLGAAGASLLKALAS
jgi:hypothetical protein